MSIKDISSEKLTITELPFGESNASQKVSDDSDDKKNSVYSTEAMLERKIEIVDVISQEEMIFHKNCRCNDNIAQEEMILVIILHELLM